VNFELPAHWAPTRSVSDAPVFSDVQCSFCQRVQETLTEISDRHPGTRLVYRDFPIDVLDPQARRAAEAARCARDHGQAREFHDILVVHAPNGNTDDLQRYAGRSVLTRAFEQSLPQGVHRAAVQRDFDEGVRLGVTATPSFFVNGSPSPGLSPYGGSFES
jgi:protein-disulfide isomerase